MTGETTLNKPPYLLRTMRRIFEFIDAASEIPFDGRVSVTTTAGI